MLKILTVIGVTSTALAAQCDPCQVSSKATCIATSPCEELVTARFMQTRVHSAGASSKAAANTNANTEVEALQKGVPMIWDSSAPDPAPIDLDGEGPKSKINPFNAIRPEYRDEPPSHKDLQQIWLHHLQDHVYKTPFIRNMKSGLWEAGVPNIYAPGGYNRRKFKTEEECLKYVRIKTGSGEDLSYGDDHAGQKKHHHHDESFRSSNEFFAHPAI